MIYKTKGTCAREISFDLTNGKVTNVQFHGGCPGNAIGVSSLIDGMEVHECIERLEGIECGMRGTSCPDQLAKALKLAIHE